METVVPPRRQAGRVPWLAAAGVAAVVLLVVGRVALGRWAEITVLSDFYRQLGLEPVYDLRWQRSLLLAAVGAAVAAAMLAPLLAVSLAAARAVSRRSTPAVLAGWLVAGPVVVALTAAGVAGLRDRLLAWQHAAAFRTADPVFGRDIAFHVFTVPFASAVAGRALVLLMTCLAIAAGVLLALRGSRGAAINLPYRWRHGRLEEVQDLTLAAPGGGAAAAATSLVYVYGGLALAALAVRIWFSRYTTVLGGDDLVAGAGRAAVDVALPARTVGALMVGGVAVLTLALAPAGVRRRAAVHWRSFAVAVGVAWAAAGAVLMVISTPWWAPFALLGALAAAVAARASVEPPAPNPFGRRAPAWAWPAALFPLALVVLAAGPAGAGLYDAVLLHGSKLQVERDYIRYTLEATRRASGIDQAETQEADFRRGGVTSAAIAAAPASLGSLRFLDAGPALQACSRLQAFNQYYACQDTDLDRYTVGGERRTVFSIGRELDYARVADFQRRHFTYTHGYGLVVAPVDEVDPEGRPAWLAGGIPQRGLEPPVGRPEIYFGAQTGMPWAMVNTDQPVFDRAGVDRRVTWDGSTGLRVGDERLAMTVYLGGLPFVGGGRRVWNATGGRPAGPDSELLLFRSAEDRAEELAPFLSWDRDPYFVAVGGRLVVLLNGYATSDRYPYAARFAGAGYARAAAVMAMDAYSGETTIYAVDEDEPITRTWAGVYPDLFTPLAEMPADLRAHLRYGEALFDFQAAAVERFHVSDVDTFYNGDEAWAPTEEASGAGVQGTRIVSPARYTYAVVPGSTQERFIVMRSYKPATQGRGIGFAGWLAVDSEPDRFGDMLILRFPQTAAEPLDSLDTFTSNVARDPALSAEIGVRRDQVVRGNTIVVPVGQGLLYVQPLYLDAPVDPLPTLWRVIVSFGDGEVHAGDTFEQALSSALGAQRDEGDTGGGPPPGAGGGSIEELVATAATEFDLYRQALADGRDLEAFEHYRAFREALEAAARLAGAGAADGAGAPPSG